MQSQIMQRNINIGNIDMTVVPRTAAEKNITIILRYDDDSRRNINILHPCQISVSYITLSIGAGTILFPATVATCPFTWLETSSASTHDVIITANSTNKAAILYVTPGQGDAADVMRYSEMIPVLWGSHLSAIVHRTERQIFSKSVIDLLGLMTPMRSLLATKVTLVQTDPRTPNSGSDDMSLRLRLNDFSSAPTEIVQDYVETSVVGGLATFGGFWTFVNGAFTMFFGANLLYFLLRRRPLSALGIVHIFQSRSLVRNWHEDFPALRTEGGLPGSKSAGIVAFIRERLVDLDDEEIESIEKDIEAQLSSSATEYEAVSTSETKVQVTSSNSSVEKSVATEPLSRPHP
ncbi:hypothetical protein C8J56DRAFT_587618 [Mycena floridula]|nr:hypothetical protein C8J56DRAFT_587618 [Mycena floridula]